MTSDKRLTELIAAYGADPKRWPEGERRGAKALLAQSPELRAMLRAESRLDAALDALPRPSADEALVRRIEAAARRRPQGAELIPAKRRALSWPRWRLIPSGLGLAGTAAALGFFMGIGWMPVSGPAGTPQADEFSFTTDAESLIFGADTIEEWEQ
jgi:hypothetical protein